MGDVAAHIQMQHAVPADQDAPISVNRQSLTSWVVRLQSVNRRVAVVAEGRGGTRCHIVRLRAGDGGGSVRSAEQAVAFVVGEGVAAGARCGCPPRRR